MKAGLKQCKRNFSSSNYKRFGYLLICHWEKAMAQVGVFRNKRNERSIVVKNKARLVAQGFRQEEATTLIESNKPLVKDEDGVDVDVHVYRSMIGSLMYLTASRLDIMFVVCVCARFQVTPKASHLNAVKRIFKYLKHQPKLGLWYPRDSPFELEAFLDSDYGGASLDRKSTTGGCQFLSRRLISWQCKKQTIVANSTTEVEYVAAANCCGEGNPEICLQDHAVVDSGCSSHMTGNKAYLSDYKDYNGGFMAFGSDPKGDQHLVLPGLVCVAQKYFTMEMMFGLGKKMLLGLVLEAINGSQQIWCCQANLVLSRKFGAARQIWCCQEKVCVVCYRYYC
ncbi:hypothetical protein Tco_1378958 [Tanacetum coccineum]